MSSPTWKNHSNFYNEALTYMTYRKEGLIQSYKTKWKKVNDAGIDGWEYNSIIILGARPGGGKTVIQDAIVRGGFDKMLGNAHHRCLQFQLEMVGRNSKLREFSAVSKRSYKHLCSAESEGVVITDELLEKCRKYAEYASKFPIDIIDSPPTVKEFEQQIHDYMKAYTYKDDEGFAQYTNTLVTIDHSILLKKDKGQSTMDMLNALGEACTKLKKMYPIIFVILSQLNRDITKPERCVPGKYGNYPNPGDIFGSDALNQHADILIIIDRPALRHIDEYGPERFIIKDDTVLALHFLKTRTGDTRMSFFEAKFQNMDVDEMNTPPQAEQKTRKKRTS
jgi:replicative DNA helicase